MLSEKGVVSSAPRWLLPCHRIEITEPKRATVNPRTTVDRIETGQDMGCSRRKLKILTPAKRPAQGTTWGLLKVTGVVVDVLPEATAKPM